MNPEADRRPVAGLPLDAGRAELLEEIMSTVAPDRATRPRPPPAPPSTSGSCPLAAAAVVAGIAAGSVGGASGDPPDGQRRSRARVAAARLPDGQGIAPRRTRLEGHLESPTGPAASDLRKGDQTSRSRRTPPTATTRYVVDREHIVDPPAPGEPITVLGRPAQMWAYTADDHTAIREVEDGHWIELRGEGMDEAAYLALLAGWRSSTRTSSRRRCRTASCERRARPRPANDPRPTSARSPARLPEGRRRSSIARTKDRYQFGAEVAGAYTCAWLEAYENAEAHDQRRAGREAPRVLGTSHDWPILEEMDTQGDYPEVLWQIADEAQAGELPVVPRGARLLRHWRARGRAIRVRADQGPAA